MKKVISVFLAVVTMLTSTMCFAVTASAAEDYKVVEGIRDYDVVSQVVSQTNAERSKVSAAGLTVDSRLTEAAMLRAAEISVYFSHTRPNGEKCYTISPLLSSGERGENVQFCSVKNLDTQSTINNWMASETHRANIVRTTFNSIGVGCVIVGDNVYWVQLFSSIKGDGKVGDSGLKQVSTVVSLSSNSTTTTTGAQSVAAVATVKKPGATSIKTVKGSKKAFKVTYKKKSGVTGYQVQYSTSSKFKKKTYKTKTIKGARYTTLTVKKLKAKKKYYVRVRTYKSSKGKKTYSKWSKAKSVTTKK